MLALPSRSCVTASFEYALMSSKIDVTVAAIIERDDKFLIVEERVAGKRVFNQPAGHLEPGETLAEAVIREVREETGFEFRPQAIVGVFLLQQPERSYLRVTFSGPAEPPADEPRLDLGIIATHWLSRLELVNRSLRSALVLQCIDAHLAGARYPLDLVVELLAEQASIAKLA